MTNKMLRITITTCMMIMVMISNFALVLSQPTCYQYPRYIQGNLGSTIIQSMDFDFPTDKMVFAGYTSDSSLHKTPSCSSFSNMPLAAAMKISQPAYLWTVVATAKCGSLRFSDVDLSSDGAKVVLAGPGIDSQNFVYLWILNASNGATLAKIQITIVSTPSTIVGGQYKQTLILKSSSNVLLMTKDTSTNNYFYLLNILYSSSPAVQWYTQSTSSTSADRNFQIVFGGSSPSSLESIIYAAQIANNVVYVSRINRSNGQQQWTQGFPRQSAYIFIEYFQNVNSNSDNLLVISNQFTFGFLFIDYIESNAASGPKQRQFLYLRASGTSTSFFDFQRTLAIFAKPNTNQVYFLSKKDSSSDSKSQISYIDLSTSIQYYKQPFFECKYDFLIFPRSIFKNENSYFSIFNCQYGFYNGALWIDSPTQTYGSYIFASDLTSYSTCYQLIAASWSQRTLNQVNTDFTSKTTPWGTPTASPVSTVFPIVSDPTSASGTIDQYGIFQNVSHCAVTNTIGKQYINYVSKQTSYFPVQVSTSAICNYPASPSPYLFSFIDTTSPTPSISLSTFTTMSSSTGIITFSDTSLSSNLQYKIQTSAAPSPSGTSITSIFQMFDLRLWFSNVNNKIMNTGEIYDHTLTTYSSTANILNTYVQLNWTLFSPSPTYFIQFKSPMTGFIISPTHTGHYGLHYFTFRITDGLAWFDQTMTVMVYNRAPTFSTDITGYNYNAPFLTPTYYTFPTVLNPDSSYQWLRVTSGQTFLSFSWNGSNLVMKILATNLMNENAKVHEVTLQLYIPPSYPNVTEYKINVTIINRPPYLAQPLVDKDIGLYWVRYYKLPNVIDPDGGSVLVSFGPTSLNKFVKLDQSSNILTFSPTETNQVGQFSIMIILVDQHNGRYTESFNLRIWPPPQFKVPLAKVIKIRIGSQTQYQLPLADTQDVYQAQSSLPSQFVKLENFVYEFYPSVFQHLGIFSIKGKLTNQWGDLVYDFKIEVFNDPPYFESDPQNIKILQDNTLAYILPTAKDPENQSISAITSQFGKSFLPPFITFSLSKFEYIISPTIKTSIGQYVIQVTLMDTMKETKSYKFVVDIAENSEENRKFSSNSTKKQVRRQNFQAKFVVTSISREGLATIKFVSNSPTTGLLALQVTNQTFEVHVLETNELVNYEINSVNEDRATVELKLLFKAPGNISNSDIMKQEMDQIKFNLIEDLEYMTDLNTIKLIKGQKVIKAVPPQITSESKAAAVFSGGNIKLTNSTTANFLLYSKYIREYNFYRSLKIQGIWMQLEDMSFLSINSMISMTVPGIVQLINNVLLSLIYVDIFMSDKWLPQLFYKNQTYTLDTEPLNNYFDENGYQSMSFIKNAGSGLVFVGLYIILLVMIGLLKLLGNFSTRQSQIQQQSSCRLKRFYLFLKKLVFWRFSIKLFYSQYPPLFTSCLINFFDMKFDKGVHIISSVFSISIVSLCGLIIMCIVYKLYMALKKGRFKKRLYKRKIGELTMDQRTDTIFGIFWKPLILLRWTVTMIIMTFLRDKYYTQIFSLLSISLLFQFIIAAKKPMINTLDNVMLFFNEIMVSAYLYMLLCLTDFMVEHNLRDKIGLLLLYLVIFTVAINFIKGVLSLLWFIVCPKICHYCKKMKKHSIKEQQPTLAVEQEQIEPLDDIIIENDNKRKKTNISNIEAVYRLQEEERRNQTGLYGLGQYSQIYKVNEDSQLFGERTLTHKQQIQYINQFQETLEKSNQLPLFFANNFQNNEMIFQNIYKTDQKMNKTTGIEDHNQPKVHIDKLKYNNNYDEAGI